MAAFSRFASEGWWGRKDSNLRSHEAADLQSAPFATRDTSPSNSVTEPAARVAEDRTMDDAEAESTVEPAAAGAFMSEGGWQSQPTQAIKNDLDRAKLPYSGPRDTSSP